MIDLSDVAYVKRITVGSSNPEALRDPSEIQVALDLVNRCLSDAPKGKIIGIERSFHLLSIGEHQVVLQYIVYHIGFTRRPAWLE